MHLGTWLSLAMVLSHRYAEYVIDFGLPCTQSLGLSKVSKWHKVARV